jgi:predicted dehydrogenase/serine acetyltransferase
MSGEKTVRVAVIGCGHWGKNLVRNMHELGALAAIFDAHAPTAEAMSKQYGVPALSYDAILADKNIDGVVIAAPAPMHAPLALAAFDAGKYVFVEKPLAMNEAEGQTMIDRARATGRILMVGHLLQYHPAYRKVRELVRGGAIGTLRSIRSRRQSHGKLRGEEDVLWSFAPHDLSMVLGLIDEAPSSVLCHGDAHVQPNIADIVSVQMGFPSGVSAQVEVSWIHPYKEQTLIVTGDAGMIVFSDHLDWQQKVVLHRHTIARAPYALNKGEAEAVVLEKGEPLRDECQHFLACIAAGATPRTDGHEAIRVLAVLEQATRVMTGSGAPKAPAKPYFVHETALVDEPATVGEGTKIWHFSHVLKNTTVGRNVTIGQNVVAGPDVSVGDNCKIQNNVSLYKGVVLEEGVFCGPSCVFTNVMNPRAEVERKTEYRQTLVKRGTSIGANATIVCGVTLNEYCFIGAGAVVIRDVPAFAMMVGNPARRIGWMSHAGYRLGPDLTCPTGRKYRETAEGTLEEVTP